MGMDPDLSRAIEFSRAFDRRRVERIVRTPHGEALLTPSLPLVYHRNHLSVDLSADASADALIAEADAVFGPAGYRFRKITIDDELGARVAPRFPELGWKVEELVVQLYRGPKPDVDASIVDEVTGADLEPLWVEGMRESPEISAEEEIRQLVAAQHARRSGAEVRYFAARVDELIASYCELFLADGVGQVESVMTLERFRKRGLAKAVVARALEESLAADTELTFIVADAHDFPKNLYAKLGFVTAGRMWDFLLASC
jgi:GNAT superfamily N-acetyltransferase